MQSYKRNPNRLIIVYSPKVLARISNSPSGFSILRQSTLTLLGVGARALRSRAFLELAVVAASGAVLIAESGKQMRRRVRLEQLLADLDDV